MMNKVDKIIERNTPKFREFVFFTRNWQRDGYQVEVVGVTVTVGDDQVDADVAVAFKAYAAEPDVGIMIPYPEIAAVLLLDKPWLDEGGRRLENADLDNDKDAMDWIEDCAYAYAKGAPKS